MAFDYTLAQIAGRIASDLAGDGQKHITGVAPFDEAGPDQITFATGSKYLNRISAVQAGAVIVPRTCKPVPGINLLLADNPQFAFTQVVAMYHPTVPPAPGISDRAQIGKDVHLGEAVHIGAFVTIGEGTTIGNRCVIHDGVYIGPDVRIGNEVTLFPHVTIMHGCRIGHRVTIHPGTVIGSDGFGFVPDGGHYHKIPQMGIVQIDDDVELGAGNTIDRATFGRTWIQRGVKTDNLVHIAHNVVIGEDSVVVAQVGIAGSTQIGHHAILAGQAGISGHLTLGNHVTVGPMTGVGKPIADGEVVSSGLPSMPHRTWLRVQRIVPALPDMKKQISELEKKIAALEKIIANT
ncbi:UDP-3-O-(3-hydroxymyristoyl)glucosamine N-acyltransferase [Desulfosarcina cetonica]|uniref:UDP-3-O-(3-hydroxymyristoyl)glucosamine N-acyltransferase n=1 Tax=Desulfosarcina cetonica TaxID=90730 RepID=UPI0006D12E8B|nr:UDP-3-O-(3-hydroxymyristoyl)glucosamine N-acyltransferase [Desulfosarcina cetonica]